MKRVLFVVILFCSTKLSSQGLGNFNGILNTEHYFEKVLMIPFFNNGISNLNVDLNLGNNAFWGYLELEITGGYNYQNSPGRLTKVFSVGVNPSGNIYANESRVSEAIGFIPDNISIGDFKWNTQSNSYVIPISHIVATGNGFVLKVKAFSISADISNILNSLSFSQHYVSPALPKNYVNFGNNVGFGTNNPQNSVHVFKNSADLVEASIQQAGSGTWSRASLGLITNGVNGAITTWAPSSARANTMWVQTLNANDLILGTNDEERIRIKGNDGNIGIGTNNPGLYKLAVEGTIGARKIKVTQTTWADDVFEPNYRLRTIRDLEKFIKKNRHLPGVPKATEVINQDIDISETQAILLRKIEELTLHIISLEKRIKNLERVK